MMDGAVELSGLGLEQRDLLVKYAVGMLQQGLSKIEVIGLLDQYIEFKQWGRQSLLTRSEIVSSALEALQKPAAEGTAKPANQPDEFQVVSLSEMEQETVRWLWPGRIPLGKVTVIRGESGQGKTCLALDLASRVSSGADWPDEAENQLSVVSWRLSVGESGAGGKNPSSQFGLGATPGCAASAPDSENRATGVERPGPGRVLLLNAEDHWGDTIRPRLVGGGANLDNITAIAGMNSGSIAGSTGGRSFDLERDIPALRRRIEMLGDVRLVIIDPLEAHCGWAGAQNRARLRRLVAALVKLADECGVAVVVISSGSKCELPVKHVWNVDCDVLDPELRLWVPVKFFPYANKNETCANPLPASNGLNCDGARSNHNRSPSGLAYRVTDDGIAWESRACPVTVDRMRGATAKQERNWRLREVAEWLKSYLAQGPCAAQEVLEASSASGWTTYQVKRAKLALGVVCRKELSANGRWLWELPTPGGRPGAFPAASRPSLETESQPDPALEWLDRAVKDRAGPPVQVGIGASIPVGTCLELSAPARWLEAPATTVVDAPILGKPDQVGPPDRMGEPDHDSVQKNKEVEEVEESSAVMIEYWNAVGLPERFLTDGYSPRGQEGDVCCPLTTGASISVGSSLIAPRSKRLNCQRARSLG